MNEMKICKYCRSEIDVKAKICPYCRKKQKNLADTVFGTIGSATLIIIAVPFIIAAFKGFNEGYNNASTSTSQEETTFETESEYKSSCKTVSYEDLARDKNMLKGKRLCLTGEIVQVDGKRFRMSITKTTFGYTDTIMFEFNTDKIDYNILEDDIITIWGESQGAYTYTAILGNEVTVPKIKAEWVERVKE